MLGLCHTATCLTDLPVGLIINFQVERLVDGVKRVINAQSSAMKSEAVRSVPSVISRR